MIQGVGIVRIGNVRGGESKSGVTWARAQVAHKEGHTEVVAFGALARALEEGRKVFLAGTPREETYEKDGATRTKLVVRVEDLQVLSEDAELTSLSVVGIGTLVSEPRPTSRGTHLSRVAFRNYRGGRREDIFLSLVTPQPAGKKGEPVVLVKGRLLGNILAGEIIKGQANAKKEQDELEELVAF